MELTPILRARRDIMEIAFDVLEEPEQDLVERYVDKFIDYLELYEEEDNNV